MSSFRRTPTSIHRHLRSISTASSPFITASSISSTSSDNRNPKLLRWISAVVAGTGIGVYLCSDSSYGVKSVMSVADWLSSSADKLKEVYHRQPLSNSNFFIRDAIRRRIFFNYQKRLRMLSPPDKVYKCFSDSTRRNCC